MPNVNVTLPETGQSVTRPVILDIVSQVQEIIKIPAASKVFFPGDSAKMSTAGSTIDSKVGTSAIFGTDRYTFIEVEENYDMDTLGNTAITRREHIPVFWDQSLGLCITPIYATSVLVINFSYRTPSKSEAIKWRDDIRVSVSNLRDINLHTIRYHYSLPPELLEVIIAVYDNMEATAGYGQTLAQYIKKYSTDRLVTLGDLVNKNFQLGVSDTQSRIIGSYTFDGIPDMVEYDEAVGAWNVKFGYKFRYEKPIACNMRYPIMVHNHLLPPQYTCFVNTDPNPTNTDKSYSLSIGALNAFEATTLVRNKVDVNSLIRIPEFDDFIMPTMTYGSATVLTALTEVDEVDLRTLLNLTELGDIMLDDDVMQFIKEVEYPYLTKLYSSVLNLTLYRNKDLVHYDTLECTASLDVKSTKDLNLRDQHRLRLSLIVDIGMVKKDAFMRLRKYPKAFVKILGSLNEMLRNRPDFNELGYRSVITEHDVNKVFTILVGFDLYGMRNSWAVIDRVDRMNPKVNSPTLLRDINAQNEYMYRFGYKVATVGIIRTMLPRGRDEM